MGVLSVTGATGRYLTAIAQTSAPGTGDPGCTVPATYSFGLVTAATVQIGLPYGSWKFTMGLLATGPTVPVPEAGLSVLTRGTAAGGVVTLDPRRTTP
jgi:hypothetical protein